MVNGTTSLPAMPGTEEQDVLAAVAVEIPSPEMGIEDDPDPNVSKLGRWVETQFQASRSYMHSSGIHAEWRRALSDFYLEYDQDTKSRLREDRSRVFTGLTRSKVAIARALILQTYFSENGLPWSLSPTAIPELEGIQWDVIRQAVAIALDQVPEAERDAVAKELDFDEQQQQALRSALEKMRRMETRVKNDLQDQGFDNELYSAIEGFLIYGTMVAHGPISERVVQQRWHRDDSGKWTTALKRSKEDVDGERDMVVPTRPTWKFLDPWRVYPDPGATRREELRYVTVYESLPRHEFAALRRDPLVSKEMVEALLVKHPTGDWKAEDWEITNPGAGPTSAVDNRFRLLKFVGFVNGRTLKDNGVSGISESLLDEECLANLWVVDGCIIRGTISNREPASMPFVFTPYEKMPGRLWGRGIPRQMRDTLASHNAAERAKMDNMGISALPQTAVDLSRLSDRTKPETIYSGKVWLFNEMDGEHKPLDMFFPPSNVEQMQRIQESLLRQVQYETNIPDFAGGLPTPNVHNRTEGGALIQKDLALGFIRSVIGNIDKYGLEPIIRETYNWEMNYGPEEVKGDYNVVVSGVQGAIAREVLVQKLTLLLNQFGEDLKYHIDGGQAIDLMFKVNGFKDMGIGRSIEEAMELKAKDAQMRAEAEEGPKRVQPVISRENALMEIFKHTDPRSPLYGPAYQMVLDLWGIRSEKFSAALNAQNQVAAYQAKAAISESDRAALEADIEVKAAVDPGGMEPSPAPPPAGLEPPPPMPAGEPGMPMGGA